MTAMTAAAETTGLTISAHATASIRLRLTAHDTTAQSMPEMPQLKGKCARRQGAAQVARLIGTATPAD